VLVMIQSKELYRAYYTNSPAIIYYMMKMLSPEPGMHIFEPCAGDGAFIDAVIQQAETVQIDAYELDPEAFVRLKKKYRLNENVQITHADTLLGETLTFCCDFGGKYDRIVANPPYGAWQDYEKRDTLRKLYPDLYVKETYTLFLFRCIKLLVEGGRLVFIVPDTFLNLHMHTSLRAYILTHTKIKEMALIPSSFFPNVNFGYSNLCIITLEKSTNQEACLTNTFPVLTDFKKVEGLKDTKGHTSVYHINQQDTYKHSNHAFFLSETDVNFMLRFAEQRIGDIADCVTGIYSGDDKRFLHPLSADVRNGKNYLPLDRNLICHDYLTRSDLLSGLEDSACFIPVIKGGAIKYLKSDLWYLDWSKEAISFYKTNKKARFQNSGYYFKLGIGIPMVSSSQVTAALIENKLFDQSIVGVFPKDPSWMYYLLAFFNSPTCNTLLRTINPSANNSANYIKKIPFIPPDQDKLELINRMMREILSCLRLQSEYSLEDEKLINDMIAEIYGF
jgi:adenine-specific DNA-methyltransferase